MVDITAGLGPLEQVAVLHANTPEDAEAVAQKIRGFYPGEIFLGNIGPALATHGGPGIVGVCAVTAK